MATTAFLKTLGAACLYTVMNRTDYYLALTDECIYNQFIFIIKFLILQKQDSNSRAAQ